VRRTSSRAARTRVTLSERTASAICLRHRVDPGWHAHRAALANRAEYQKQMMALALFLPQPRHVLQLGLGAAALDQFCYRHRPNRS